MSNLPHSPFNVYLNLFACYFEFCEALVHYYFVDDGLNVGGNLGVVGVVGFTFAPFVSTTTV